MQGVDEVHEVLWRAVIAGRCEIASRLIAPGPKKRMVRQREKLHMREPHLL